MVDPFTIAAAAVSIGSAISSFLKGNKAAEEQGNAVKEAARLQFDSTEKQLEFLRETRADLAEAAAQGIISVQEAFDQAFNALDPLVFAGDEALNQVNKLLRGEIDVLDLPGTKQELAFGQQALTDKFGGITGGGISGRELGETQLLGQNVAATQIDKELARLMPVVNLGAQARFGQSELVSGKGTNVANIGLTGAGMGANLAPSISAVLGDVGSIGAESALALGQIEANRPTVFDALSSGINTAASAFDLIGSIRGG